MRIILDKKVVYLATITMKKVLKRFLQNSRHHRQKVKNYQIPNRKQQPG
jgi:hypothetical protein